MRRKWVRGALVAVLVLVLLAAGLFAADRVAALVFDHGLFEPPKPAMADVLDGRVANDERLAAISAMSELSRGLTTDGVTPVAKTVGAACVEGQNNWKRRDGYRLSCWVDVKLVQAWSGDYAETAVAIHEKLASECPAGTLPPSDPHEPAKGEATTVVEYTCDESTSVFVYFAPTQGITSSSRYFPLAEATGSSRYISGPLSSEIVEVVSSYQWFAVVDARRTFFQDQP